MRQGGITVLKKKIVIIIFSLMLFITTLSLLSPNRKNSDLEYRSLAQFPSTDIQEVLNGTYFQELEAYQLDQLVFRDSILKSSSKIDKLLLKSIRKNHFISNSGYILEFEDYQEQTLSSLQESLDKPISNLQNLKNVSEKSGGQFIFIDIPQKYDFHNELFPNYFATNTMHKLEYNNTLRTQADKASVQTISGSDVFLKNGLLEPYYKTDNHYTADASLLIYQELLETINDPRIQTRPISNYERIVYESPFIGNNSRTMADTSYSKGEIFYYLKPQNQSLPKYKRYEDSSPSDEPVMIADETISLYGNYMNGDKANTVIKTKRDNLPKILFIGDSFTNALEYLSIYDFKEVHSLDLRSYKGNVYEYIEKNKFDVIVFVRNTQLNLIENE